MKVQLIATGQELSMSEAVAKIYVAKGKVKIVEEVKVETPEPKRGRPKKSADTTEVETTETNAETDGE